MPTIVTLTLNPAIDNSCEAEQVLPTQKTRTTGERLEPGGGGVNVARVLHRFGDDVLAMFTAGGVNGLVLDHLLDRTGVRHCRIPIADDTRMSLTVHERSTGCEYRFVPEGPELSTCEWEACLERIESIDCDYFVASGSLPRGVPADFYVRCRDVFARRPTRFVLDTSGPELAASLARGGLFLLKPSLGELEEAVGHALPTRREAAHAAAGIVASGQAEHVAVSYGRDGAMMVDRNGARFIAAVPVETVSAVGAGDSFLAAMVHAFSAGRSANDALRLGVAAGAAAAMTPGSDLAHPSQIRALFERTGEGEPV